MYAAWITIGALMLIIEGTLWLIFVHKLRGLHFPRSVDESFFRFFSLTRLRLVAVLHTLFLLAIFVLVSLYVW